MTTPVSIGSALVICRKSDSGSLRLAGAPPVMPRHYSHGYWVYRHTGCGSDAGFAKS